MVAEAQAERAAASPTVRQRRQREEELLVWPDLVFVEFIAAVLFTLTFTLLSILINAPLQDRANPAHTPNPSKAPWYFLNLQELLLHMHPALAGVIVPTVFLVVLAAVPYWDNTNEGQGKWFATPRAVTNTVIGFSVGFVGTWLLILWDSSKHVVAYEKWTGETWPSTLAWARNARALQTDIGWPEDWTTIPLGEKVLRTDLLGLPKVNLNVNLPALVVEQAIPVTLMIGLPILLSIVGWRAGFAKTRRDHMILLFSGWVGAYLVLTVVGTVFRGQDLELLFPWDVKPAES